MTPQEYEDLMRNAPWNQECECCGDTGAVLCLLQRTMGGCGNPEVDVQVERWLCEECRVLSNAVEVV